MKPASFDYAPVETLGAALSALSAQGAKPLAGGQSLAPTMNLRLVRPRVLVDVKALPGMREVTETAAGLRLGAAVTHAEIEDGAVPDVTCGFMAHVARGIAYRAVRNRGTIGGSLCHADPAADWPSCMVALGATMIAAGPGGERRIAARDWMRAPFVTALAPGEMLLAVEIPRLPPGSRWGYAKINRKVGEFASALGIALPGVMVAGAIEAPPALLHAIEGIPPLAAVAVTRAVAMRDA
ncbi:carbon monoxide dehydrogenase [Rhodovarius crocodyli]|uniref:Carbon monoxide dehydrogenase n=1 Tax=Rhodovarius crocodyli TaxID=1979269 RepID=A0A437MEM6_9PROT|nr:FAD binding domain-containing protein [Rhodovarius crocodyli]RVT96083.1 carbon monoxide dehydrogenase [Rhodovarius crocodyli]